MKVYLLDSTVIIDYLRGKQEIINVINNLDGELTSSFVCLAELYEGVYRVHNPQQVREAVMNFFTSLSYIFNLNHHTAETFGCLRAALKQKGKAIDDLDFLIAATCLENDLTLVTSNIKHFHRVPDLKIHQP